MITKTGKDLQKQAGFGLAALAHLGQNVVTKNLLGSERLAKHLGNKFMHYTRGAARGLPIHGEVGIAATRGIIPETGIFDHEMASFGKKLNKSLIDNGVDAANISREHVDVLKNLLQGDFVNTLKNNPEAVPILFDAMAPQLQKAGVDPKMVSMAVSAAIKQGDTALLTDLEDVWKSTKFTSKLMSNMGKHLPVDAPNTARGISNEAAHYVQAAGDVAGLAPLTYLDPITGAVNMGKKFLASQKFGYTPVKATRDFLNRKFVTEPIAKSFQKGLAGEVPKFVKSKKFVLDYGLNPITADIQHLSRRTGLVLHKHNVIPRLQKAQRDFERAGFELPKPGTLPSANMAQRTSSGTAIKPKPVKPDATLAYTEWLKRNR